MAVELVSRVHPVIFFSIVDSYERRNEDAIRVIGTLLGTCDKGVVEVTNCFTVPHNESEDEVAIDIDFARNMYELHRKVNAAESIVGWYSTGSEVTEHSVLIHEYYSRECKNPIHMTVDTTLKNNKMGMKAFLSASMGVPGKTVGTMFTPIPVEIISNGAEQVGVNCIQQGKLEQRRTVTMVNDLQHVTSTCQQLQEMLNHIVNYVDEVVAGRIQADSTTGRYLMNLVSSVPKIEAESFEEMLNTNIKDILMVQYLSQLTKTQLLLSEKIALLP